VALATACGGTANAGDDDGVASLDEGGAAAPEAGTESAQSVEEQTLEWAQCMRDEGVDIPDPEVDEDGGMQLRVEAGGGGDRPDPEDIEAAQEVCGDPPMVGNIDPAEQAQFQDAALAFAQCMRDRGHDVSDPQSDGEGRVRFGQQPDMDPDDPEVAADAQACQEESFGQLERNGPGGEGATGGGS
jgi:hypothetical protein